MKRIIITALMMAALLAGTGTSFATELLGPQVSLRDNTIIVSTNLALSEDKRAEVRRGVSKEIVFYIDLFKSWKYWPDEFVLGKRVKRTLECDDVRKKYVMTEEFANTRRETNFDDCDTLVTSSQTIRGLLLTSTQELEAGEYYVKVVVESRLRSLPPFIDLLFFFVKDKEFRLESESPSFPLKFDE